MLCNSKLVNAQKCINLPPNVRNPKTVMNQKDLGHYFLKNLAS